MNRGFWSLSVYEVVFDGEWTGEIRPVSGGLEAVNTQAFY